MDASDALLAARDALRDRGWGQGHMVADDGRLCLIGALNTVGREGVVVGGARLVDYCGSHYRRVSLIQVNDWLLTSEDEACDLLEAAAKWDGGA